MIPNLDYDSLLGHGSAVAQTHWVNGLTLVPGIGGAGLGATEPATGIAGGLGASGPAGALAACPGGTALGANMGAFAICCKKRSCLR